MSHDSLYVVYSVPSLDVRSSTMLLRVYGELLPEDIGSLVESVLKSKLSRRAKDEIVISIISDFVLGLGEDEIREVAREARDKLEGLLVGRPVDETVVLRFSIQGLNLALKANQTLPGRVLDQFALDEWGDTFRVAVTINRVVGVEVSPDNPLIFWPDVRSETALYVLSKDDLAQLSSVEGLAPGERVYAARYLGDKAFLVTFRRVDPLFAIDLSDPRNPRVVGEVKIPGYSEYLHPYGDLLLGVGVDATEEGRPIGLKISLFDISSLEDVKEVDNIRVPEAWSEVLYDYHAFLPGPNGSFYMPVTARDGEYVMSGVVDLEEKKLIRLCEVFLPGVRRAIYVKDTLYLVSLNELLAVEPDTCAVISSLVYGFPQKNEISAGPLRVLGYSYRVFDNILEVSLKGYLPNPCYEASPAEALVEDETISLIVGVREPLRTKLCPQVIQDVSLEFRLLKPAPGSYEIVLITEISGAEVSRKVAARLGTITID
jgi:uncharacterized secreted protein with C-terminal beta-propeller domain